MDQIVSGGRRKAATARVFIKNGSGNITINGKEFKDYFPMPNIHNKILEPIKIVEADNAYDININVRGGGFKGQAEAIRLGIARGFVKLNEDNKSPLKAEKLLTRDSRVVERKKYGKPKARKSFQFSKR